MERRLTRLREETSHFQAQYLHAQGELARLRPASKDRPQRQNMTEVIDDIGQGRNAVATRKNTDRKS
jgi:hypothetical protein